MVRHCLWKMPAPGACIKSGLVRRPSCHKVTLPSCVARQPLCHKVDLPRGRTRRRHLIMTCDIVGSGQTNTSPLCYLLGKTYNEPGGGVLPYMGYIGTSRGIGYGF